MDGEERALFVKGVEDAVARHGRAPSGDLDATLADLGWGDAFVADDRAAVTALFEAQGRAAVTSGTLDLVLADALGAGPAAAVLLPPLGQAAPPARLEGGAVVVDGLGTVATARASAAAGVIAAAAGDGATADGATTVVTVELDALTCRPVGGLDPWMGLVEVRGGPVPAGTAPMSAAAWEEAVAAGRRALGHELVGASAAMLELARRHALERVQFGVPIASFQAVRHRLADTLVAIEAARGALDAAWEDRTPGTATAAKALAGRGARLAARHCQQVLAGIGFTAEHPLHRYVRRVRVLDGLLGDARSLTRAIGADLLRSGRLPPMLPLTARWSPSRPLRGSGLP